MAPWVIVYIIAILAIAVWLYSVATINNYNPHVPKQDEWRIYRKRTLRSEEE